MTTIADRARKVITDHLRATYDRPLPEITDATVFTDDLRCDSLDGIEILVALEDEFDVEVQDHEAADITTFGHVVEYLNRRLA